MAYYYSIPIEEMVSEIDTIQAEDVVRVAARIFGGSRPSLAALGPIAELESFESLAARFD